MSLIINIQGGTSRQLPTPKAQRKTDWTCLNCGARCKFYWRNCPNCSEGRRPEEE